jgi:hypothetical protein
VSGIERRDLASDTRQHGGSSHLKKRTELAEQAMLGEASDKIA